MITRYLTQNPCYQQGRKIAVKGLMLHSVGVPQPDPLVFIRIWDSPTYDRACVHGFIGRDECYVTLPVFERHGAAFRGWHGGGSSNNGYIGVEMCEPSTIRYTGGASFEVKDRAAAVAFVEKTTRRAVELFADLCRFHDLDPLADGVILSHAEGHRRGIASNHGDPDHLWRGLGMDYDMDRFRADVAAAMKGEEMVDIGALIAEMTDEQAYALVQKAQRYSESLPEPPWSQKEGHWKRATEAGIVDGKSPERPMKRDEVIAVLGRKELL